MKRRLSIIVVLGVCALKLYAQSVQEVFSNASMQDVRIPLYTSVEHANSNKNAKFNSVAHKELVALLHVQKVYTDYERRFFLRIGALPVEVLDGVTIEICNPAQAANKLEHLTNWLTPQRARRIELRKVSLVAGQNRLDAGQIRLAANGKWELSEGVKFSIGTNVIQAASATLQTSGIRAGEIVIQSSPTSTNHLF